MAASSQSRPGPSWVARKFCCLARHRPQHRRLYGGVVLRAGWLRNTVLAVIAPGPAKSMSGECGDIAFRSYPFRIGLICSKLTMADRNSGVSASFGALRSAAQLYASGHIVLELDSPGQIRTAHGLAVSAAWEDLQSSLVTRFAGIDRTSLAVKGVKATAASTCMVRS